MPPGSGDLNLIRLVNMQQRAGLLYLSKETNRVLLVLENQTWTVPTFSRTNGIIHDAENLFKAYSNGKVIPIELYLSKDKGFEYGTYICLVDKEFLTLASSAICWCHLDNLPKNVHSGLKNTLSNKMIQTKIETILELEDVN